ncbi:Virulence-regulating protein VirS (plasmid) [Marinibacterium anthonyi]|nr:Virulence-regulating protein VirS [Marinibacterium anthonyi]
MALDWQVPPFWAMNIARHLEDRTGTAARALTEVGLPADLLRSPPDRVRIGDETALLKIAARDTGDEIIACEAGIGFDPRRTSLLSYLLLNARTLEEGIVLAHRYLRIERQRAVFASRLHGNTAFLHVDARATELRDHPLYIEHALGAILAVIRRAVGTELAPREVHLMHRRPKDFERRLEDTFEGEVRSGASLPGLVLDRATLDLPLVDPDTVLLPHLTTHARMLLEAQRERHGDLGHRVRDVIATHLSKGAPTKARVARILGMSPRTLSRRLGAEGSSYEGLLLALRRDLADRYLGDRTLGQAQIAHLLGYADQPSFTTAYKRWTGTTPGAARRRGGIGRDAKTSDPP